MRIFRPPQTDLTQKHYEVVMKGGWKDRLWGAERRFNADKSRDSESIRQYFTAKVSGRIQPTDRVLDLGCGSGLFLPIVAGLCRELVGVDVSPAMVEASRDVVRRFDLRNTVIQECGEGGLEFGDAEFDVLLLVDTIHHVYHLEPFLAEARRVLKPGGRLLCFEPNKLNPLLYAMCLLDRNEWGLLGLGRRGIYRRLFQGAYRIECMEYNGLLIGPDSPTNRGIVNLLNHPRFSSLLGWMNPKLFFSLRKPEA